MLNKIQFQVLTALAVSALVLTIINIVVYSLNRSANGEVSARAQYIQQNMQIQPLYDTLVRNLAGLAAKNNDGKIRQLLGSQGITFNVNTGQEEKSSGKK